MCVYVCVWRGGVCVCLYVCVYRVSFQQVSDVLEYVDICTCI